MAAKRRDYFKLKASEAFQVDRTGAPLGELGITIPSLTDLTNFLANAKKVLSDTTKLGTRLQKIRIAIGKIKNTAIRNNIAQRFASASQKFTTISKQLDVIRGAYSAAVKVINSIKGAVGLRGNGLGLSPQAIALIPTVIKGISVLAIAVGAIYTINRYLDMVEKDIAKQIEIEKIAAQREKERTQADIFRKQEEAKYEYYMQPLAAECPDLPQMSDSEYCVRYPNCCETAAKCPDLPEMSDEEYCARYPNCCETAEGGLWGLEGRDQRWDNVPYVRRIGVKVAELSARNRMYDNRPEHQVARIQGLGSSSDQNRMNRRKMGLEKARSQQWDILRQARLGNIMQKLKKAMVEAGI